jgi:hypothetical protein
MYCIYSYPKIEGYDSAASVGIGNFAWSKYALNALRISVSFAL